MEVELDVTNHMTKSEVKAATCGGTSEWYTTWGY